MYVSLLAKSSYNVTTRHKYRCHPVVRRNDNITQIENKVGSSKEKVYTHTHVLYKLKIIRQKIYLIRTYLIQVCN